MTTPEILARARAPLPPPTRQLVTALRERTVLALEGRRPLPKDGTLENLHDHAAREALARELATFDRWLEEKR